ncbi:centromere-associated protein E isoform X3, partial [Biomphalaria glabrata]
DHSCSKPPAVDCISEGEEEEESNLSLTTEKRDIDIQTDMNTANGLDEIRKCAMDKLEISQDRKSMDLEKQEKCVQQNNDQPKLEEELLKDKLDELISKEKSLS